MIHCQKAPIDQQRRPQELGARSGFGKVGSDEIGVDDVVLGLRRF